ncbi:MAG: NAD(P)H-dependent oxidoreductase subunit E [Acidobacteriota bacterium]
MVDVSKVRDIVSKHGGKREHLIAMLLDCQEEFHYIPREVVTEVATQVAAPITHVLGIATFFRAFSLKPVGVYPVHVCLGTACHVQGGVRLLEALERQLGVPKGETTKDMLFSVDSVNCLGCCGLAPVIMIGPNVHGKLKQAQIPRILKKYRKKEAEDAKTDD